MTASGRRLPLWGRPRRRLITFAGVITVLAVVALAGQLLLMQSKAPPASLTTASATPGPTETASASESPAAKTTVVWYVGLGAGSQPNQLQAETDFVNNYNLSNKDDIILQLQELNPGGNATDTWRTPFDSGKGPDVIGPSAFRSAPSTPATGSA